MNGSFFESVVELAEATVVMTRGRGEGRCRYLCFGREHHHHPPNPRAKQANPRPDTIKMLDSHPIQCFSSLVLQISTTKYNCTAWSFSLSLFNIVHFTCFPLWGGKSMMLFFTQKTCQQCIDTQLCTKEIFQKALDDSNWSNTAPRGF